MVWPGLCGLPAWEARSPGERLLSACAGELDGTQSSHTQVSAASSLPTEGCGSALDAWISRERDGRTHGPRPRQGSQGL